MKLLDFTMQVIQFRIFLVRHGQTDNNVRHLLQGQKLDAPLNSRGKQQSKAIARSVALDLNRRATNALLACMTIRVQCFT